MTRPFRALIVVAVVASGCAHRTSGPGTAAVAGVKAKPAHAGGASDVVEVGGVYDWVLRGSDSQGNMRVEQEEWHLNQQGRVLDGWYDRTVTVMSGDDRLFRCNQQLGFSRHTRVRVAGALDGGNRVRLQEMTFEARPGPCDDGARNLVAYKGEVSGLTMRLHWAEHTAQTLHKRDAADATDAADPSTGGPAAAQSASTEPGLAPKSASLSLPVNGVWQWELKSVDAEGDSRVEHEEWHLRESPDGIEGYYDRKVARVRGEGTFPCNDADHQENTTRYTINGHRLGDQLVLTEVDYKSPKSPCDNGLRRLDTYQGHVTPGGDELILTWGSGNQVLRRWHSP